MMGPGFFLRRFRNDTRGSALIETAFVAPVLILMSLGGVEVANMVKRQHELQNAASKAAEIMMAAHPKDEAELSVVMQQLAAAIEDDTGLDTSAIGSDVEPDETKNDVGYVLTRYRCGNSKTFKKADTGCTDSPNAERFVVFLLRDKYTPVWNDFGIGEELQYRVEKSVQIG
ncbi:TadE/TadG family type IV pilus assembly protein [Croceicoccus sp. Ery5]|jgi:Flp pilus assembly protein TadG|uniref:TadE/TadG family type IV pilus assembly protein n=1 Tax=Croceicoccus sp. Ery5 TaxID=1703340 RepID=UPI001E39C0F1|nr:TadE/TadG family type IV pilus assembly protein [Croceicoccus sp. Ery5]